MSAYTAQTVPLSFTAATDSLALQQVWKKLNAQSCPYFYNFHMHTVCSDGKLQPEALISQAISIGLFGLAITDHHTIEGYKAAQRCLEQIRKDNPHQRLPHLWTGVEVTSNLFGTEVHILGYAFELKNSAMLPYLQGHSPQDNNAADVIAAIHKAGGLAVLAHPARYRRSATELIPLAAELGIDGVEAYYAYGNPQPWTPSPTQTQQVQQLGEQYHLFNTCGTDTHGLNLLRRL